MRDGDNSARRGEYKAAIDSYTLDLNIKESTQTRYRRAYCHVLLKKYELAIEDCTQNLAADPKDLESQRLRGWGYVQIGKLGEAVWDYEALAAAQPKESAHCYALGVIRSRSKEYAGGSEWFERAIRLDPHDPHAYIGRIRCLLMLKQNDQAIQQVTALLKSNPRQTGGYARTPAFARELTEEDLKHGYEQLWAMLRDRPQMAAGLSPQDALYQWAARKFAGEDIAERILWESSEPAQAEADHRSPRNGQPGSIRVVSRKRGLLGLLPGRRLTFDESWARVCYELHNIQGTPDFDQATRLASRGELTRDGYIRQYAFVEYQAALRTRAFYADTYFPLASEKKIETHPEEWYLDVPATFDDLARPLLRPFRISLGTLRSIL